MPSLLKYFPKSAYLKLIGTVGMFHPEELQRGYSEFIESPYQNLIIDFKTAHPETRQLSYDTSIPAKLLEFLTETKKRNGELKIILDEEKRKIFKLSGLESCFNFIPNNTKH